MQCEKDKQQELNLHAKQQIRIVLAVHRNKTVFPLKCGDTPRKAVLHIPEDTSAKVDCTKYYILVREIAPL